MTAANQLRHLAVEKCQQQCTDVRAVDVGISHDDDVVIAQLVRIKFVTSDTTAQRGNQRTDFGRLQHTIETGFLYIQDFALQRQNCLTASIPALLGRAAGGVSLYQIDFRFCRIAFLAIGKLAGQACDIKNTFCLLYTSPSPRDLSTSRMPSSA